MSNGVSMVREGERKTREYATQRPYLHLVHRNHLCIMVGEMK
jgi:hypothetical protein